MQWSSVKSSLSVQLSGAAVIQAICEINGCFGHIGRDGKFHYIYLEQDIQGLYPSNELFPDHAPDYLFQSKTHHLYPQNPKSTNIGKSFYITANYEGYHVKGIDKLQIRKEENASTLWQCLLLNRGDAGNLYFPLDSYFLHVVKDSYTCCFNSKNTVNE